MEKLSPIALSGSQRPRAVRHDVGERWYSSILSLFSHVAERQSPLEKPKNMMPNFKRVRLTVSYVVKAAHVFWINNRRRHDQPGLPKSIHVRVTLWSMYL